MNPILPTVLDNQAADLADPLRRFLDNSDDRTSLIVRHLSDTEVVDARIHQIGFIRSHSARIYARELARLAIVSRAMAATIQAFINSSPDIAFETTSNALKKLAKNNIEIDTFRNHVSRLVDKFEHLAIPVYDLKREQLLIILEKLAIQIQKWNSLKFSLDPFVLSFHDFALVIRHIGEAGKPSLKILIEHRFEELSNADIRNFCKALQVNNCKITGIKLVFNFIGFEGALALAETIGHPNCMLTSINLSENQIQARGARALAEALKVPFNKITNMNLAYNHIGNQGVMALAEAMKKSSCKITNLNLSHNLISDEGALALADAMKHPNCQLAHIDLEANLIRTQGALALAEAITHPECKLRKINLNSNTLGTDGINALDNAQARSQCEVIKRHPYSLTPVRLHEQKNLGGWFALFHALALPIVSLFKFTRKYLMANHAIKLFRQAIGMLEKLRDYVEIIVASIKKTVSTPIF